MSVCQYPSCLAPLPGPDTAPPTQELNPLPYPAQFANASAWMGYSYVIARKDVAGGALVYWPNQIGMMLGLFFTISCYGLADTKASVFHNIKHLFNVCTFTPVDSILVQVLHPPADLK